MKHMLSLDIAPLAPGIQYTDRILLIGSCFTEHMADKLMAHKFQIVTNPHGILFNPLSVADSIKSYVQDRQYIPSDLCYLNELYHSWDHHTRFSHTQPEEALAMINASQSEAHIAIKEASYLIITLGSAFQYYLIDGNRPVANNHRAPGQWFEKRLLNTQQIVQALQEATNEARALNSQLKVIYTISPVRHIRDGVVANNRSKARLLEAVHQLCEQDEASYYFPAYELIIDVLRDYRYYDIDMVHPNYMATQFVWEHFVQACIHKSAQAAMQDLLDVHTALHHKVRFPNTKAHQDFINRYAAKVVALQKLHPNLDFGAELAYFKHC